MKILRTALPEILVLESTVYRDDRGSFFESFNQRRFAETVGVDHLFVQDNQSTSQQHVLRGLHYQLERPQGKLVRVVAGEIFDVAVDLRTSSPRLGRWVGVHLCGTEARQLWIPEGFAHGFLVLSGSADVLYKTTDYYAPEAEHTLLWNDPALAIDWPLTAAPIVSPRDAEGRSLSDSQLFA